MWSTFWLTNFELDKMLQIKTLAVPYPLYQSILPAIPSCCDVPGARRTRSRNAGCGVWRNASRHRCVPNFKTSLGRLTVEFKRKPLLANMHRIFLHKLRAKKHCCNIYYGRLLPHQLRFSFCFVSLLMNFRSAPMKRTGPIKAGYLLSRLTFLNLCVSPVSKLHLSFSAWIFGDSKSCCKDSFENFENQSSFHNRFSRRKGCK